MLKTRLTHPTILAALAGAGHGAKVLIADGNYPFSTASNPNAELVYLNLTPGIPTVLDVLKAVLGVVPIEAAEVMEPIGEQPPPLYDEFRAQLPEGVHLTMLERLLYYDAARSDDLALVIATGDPMLAVNIMLTIGVIHPPA